MERDDILPYLVALEATFPPHLSSHKTLAGSAEAQAIQQLPPLALPISQSSLWNSQAHPSAPDVLQSMACHLAPLVMTSR